MENQTTKQKEPEPQQNIIKLLKQIKQEQISIPFAITKIEQHQQQYFHQSSPEIHYQIQTYQTPIPINDNPKPDSLIIESIHKGTNLTFSNDTSKTNPSPFQHGQITPECITDIPQISTPNMELNYDINTYNSFLTQVNPNPYSHIRTPSPQKRLKGSKSSNNFFSDKRDLLFDSTLFQNGLLNITDSKTYKMSKPSNYENDLLIKESFMRNRNKHKMSEYIMTYRNKWKYGKKSKSLTPLKHSIRSCKERIMNGRNFNMREMERKGRKIGLMMNLLQKNNNDKELVLEITRGMRNEKGGVVDFAYMKNDKCSSCSSQIVKYGKNTLCINNKKVISSVKIIQKWWRNIINIYNMLNLKVIKIQSVYRGWYYRNSILNRKNIPRGNVLILKEQQITKHVESEPLINYCETINNIEILQHDKNKTFKNEALLLMKNILIKSLYRRFNDLINNINNHIISYYKFDKGIYLLTDILQKQKSDSELRKPFSKLRNYLYKHKTPFELVITPKESIHSYLHETKRPISNEISFEDAFSFMNRPKCKLPFTLSTINECELYYQHLLKVKTFKQIYPSKVNEMKIYANEPRSINITTPPKQKQLSLSTINEIIYTPNIPNQNNSFQISKCNFNIHSSHKENVIENINEFHIPSVNDYKKLKKVVVTQHNKNKQYLLRNSVNKFKLKELIGECTQTDNNDEDKKIQPLLRNNKKRFLYKNITINDLRNKINLYLAMLKWYRKAFSLKNMKRVNIRKRILNDNEIQKILYRNLLRYVLTQIQKEAKRRRIIKLFYYLEGLKIPIQHYVFTKIKKYSNVKFQLMNLCAILIQRYYRLKYKNGSINDKLLLIEEDNIESMRTTHIIIEETYPHNYTFQYKTYLINSEREKGKYDSFNNLIFDFYRKYNIRYLIESLYCVYYKH